MSAHGVLAACWPGKRSMADGASLLFHGTSLAAYGDAERLRAAADHLDASNREVGLRISRRSKLSVQAAMRLLRDGEDATVPAELAVEMGLADEVLPAVPGH